MNCPRCEQQPLQAVTVAQRSHVARGAGIALLAGAAGLIIFAISLMASPDPLLGILELLLASMVLFLGGCLLGGAYALLWKKSEARGPWRCPRCGKAFEAGAYGTLTPIP